MNKQRDADRINKITDKLVLVQKPASYTGGELNSICKESAFFRAAICYPDLYEIGMSNNGIQILYAAANKLDHIACERVFAPAQDFEALLKAEDLCLYTLETRTPLCKLDLLGFNLSQELVYTNVLKVLDTGRIPLLRKERSDDCPLIIAGGSAASNPFPMSDFIDAFYIGDGEEGFPEILQAAAAGKRMGLSRKDIIEKIGEIQGVLLPHKYKFTYDGFKLVSVEGRYVVKRNFYDAVPSDAVKPVVPSIRVTQGRATVALAKGCFNLCKFCHAGYYDLPYRTFSCEHIADAAMQTIANTGYNELTLSALSVGDYGKLNRLLNLLLPKLTEAGVSVSLPSLKVDESTLPVISCISDVRRSSLTFAVESGSPELRAYAHKRLDEEELLRILEYVFTSGWNLVKLYFMIGLPGCERIDEAGSIVDLLKKISALPNKRKEINVSLSPFVPKPHTPFERARQMDRDYFFDVITRVKKSLPKFINVKNHNLKATTIEAVFSRGDARLGAVLLNAYKKGCCFDSWNEHFKFNIWEETLNELIPDWQNYFNERMPDDILPWKAIVTGRENLIAAMNKRSCCPKTTRREQEPLDNDKISSALDAFQKKYKTLAVLRLRFSKTGDARFVPHLDFAEIIKRAMRMADIPAAFTQGFNKREKILLGPAISVGMESLCEYCDTELWQAVSEEEAMLRLNEHLPTGIRVTSAQIISDESVALSNICAARYAVAVEDDALFATVAANLENKPNFIKETKSGKKTIAFSAAVLSYEIKDNNRLELVLSVGGEGGVRADAVMVQLGNVDYNNVYLFRITKQEQLAAAADGLLAPV